MPANLPFRPMEQGVSEPPRNREDEMLRMLNFLRIPVGKPGVIASNFGGK
jgi:hypothetical protein